MWETHSKFRIIQKDFANFASLTEISEVIEAEYWVMRDEIQKESEKFVLAIFHCIKIFQNLSLEIFSGKLNFIFLKKKL